MWKDKIGANSNANSRAWRQLAQKTRQITVTRPLLQERRLVNHRVIGGYHLIGNCLVREMVNCKLADIFWIVIIRSNVG